MPTYDGGYTTNGEGPECTLPLAQDERQWLAITLGVPRLREAAEALGLEADPGTRDARRLRAVLLAACLDTTPADIDIPLSLDELWVLDTHVTAYDLRDAKLPSGRLLADFARKLWAAIAALHRDDLPPSITSASLPSTSASGKDDHDDARDTRSRHSDAHEGADAVAEAEALLRPTDDA